MGFKKPCIDADISDFGSAEQLTLQNRYLFLQGRVTKVLNFKKSKKSKEAKQAAKLDSSEESDVQLDSLTHDAYTSCNGKTGDLKDGSGGHR